MEETSNFPTPEALAEEINARLLAQTVRNTESLRGVRRAFSHQLKTSSPAYVLAVVRLLFHRYSQRWVAYELVAAHKKAFHSLGPAELEEFGQGMHSWDSVDSFARTLSGPAWRDGQVPDELILGWAVSPDFWWRRVALVSSVALNVRSQGGQGDIPRTLAVCRLLVDDHADMVVKAMSWALRELIAHDPQAVIGFLDEYGPRLAGRVKREVGNKLKTGLKNPRQR